MAGLVKTGVYVPLLMASMFQWSCPGPPAPPEQVPPPIDMLLPQSLEVHPFTRYGPFDTGGGGLGVWVVAKDSFDAETRAFGRFRFEIHEYLRQGREGKGKRLQRWDADLSGPEMNLVHWDRHTRSYEFKLGWDKQFLKGTELVVVVFFESRFTERLVAERKIVVGEKE